MLNTKGKTAYIPEFDGLRGLLALWVLVYHVVTIAGIWDRIAGPLPRLLDAANAVGIFIILSGFVVTTLLATTSETYGRYIARRFFRLWPTLMVCLALALIAQSSGWMPQRGDPTWLHVALHSTMLHGLPPEWLLPNSAAAILNPAWSISLEWQFYLLAPFALSARRSIAARFLISAAAAFLMYRLWVPIVGDTMHGSVTLPSFAPLFLVGIVSSLVFRSAELGDKQKRSLLTFTALGAAALAFVFLPFVANLPVLFWAMLFAAIMKSRFHGSIQIPILMGATMQFLGRISYPLYLCHEVWLWVVQSGFKALGLTGWALVAADISAGLPLSIATAWLLHLGVEKPAMAWAKKTISREATPAFVR